MHTPRKEYLTAFTLIELIIVIIIAAILAAIAITQWPGKRINLNAQTQQLASDLRYTQTLAMSRAAEYTLTLTSSSYSISTGGTTINNPITGGSSSSLGTGITITIPPANLPNNSVTFNSQGIPYTDTTATTALANAAIITLTSGSSTTTITIQPQTGRITVP